MRFLIALMILAATLGTAVGQDAVQCLEQLQTQSELLNTTSSVFFDATLVESSSNNEELRQSRFVGRRVAGPKGEIRVDVFTTSSDLATGEEISQFEHFIRYGTGDYMNAIGLLGSELTMVDHSDEESDQKLDPRVPPGFGNPFLVALNGELSFKQNVGEFGDWALVPMIEDALKPALDLRARFIKRIKFGNTEDWEVVSWKAAINPVANDYRNLERVGGARYRVRTDHLPRWDELKNPSKYTSDWVVIGSGIADWILIKDVGILPSRIIYQSNGVPRIDGHGKKSIQGRKKDFEVIYFGYDFSAKSAEKFVDRQRFNAATIPGDFPIRLIMGQADDAKKSIQRKSSEGRAGR